MAAVNVDTIRVARTWAMNRCPYLSFALCDIILVAVKDMGTWGIDKLMHLFYDPEKVMGTGKIEEYGAVLLHEIWHPLRLHFTRGEGRDPKLWNIATDCIINKSLRDMGILVPDGLFPERFGYTGEMLEETLYDWLAKNPGKVKSVADPKCGSGAGNPQPWESNAPPGSGVGLQEQGLISRAVAKEIKEAAGRGTLSGDIVRWADSMLDPQVPWQNRLRAATRRAIEVQSGRLFRTFTRVPRRDFPGILCPGHNAPTINVALVIDTSGSMSAHHLEMALAEAKGCIRAAGAKSVPVLACDSEVKNTQRVTNVRQIKLAGGGGTSMTKGIESAVALRPQPSIIVILTDGYTDWPSAPFAGTKLIACILNGSGDGCPDFIEKIEVRL